MTKLTVALAAISLLGLSACTTPQGAMSGALIGGAVGGVASQSVVGAVIGAGVGALAGAVLVEQANDGWCTYRYNGKLYRDRCQA